VITCLDPRVDPAHFRGLGLSDAIVFRNVGGRVTPDVINDVAFIGQIAETVLPDGPLFEVAVIDHTQCGAGAPADDRFPHRYTERIGADESALRLPGHAVHPQRGARTNRPVRRPQTVDIDVMQKRREPCLLVLLRDSAYTIQRTRHALFGSVSGTRFAGRVPLGQPPFLHRLRDRLRGVVRRLRRYYGAV